MYVQHDRCEEGISWSLCTPRWPKLSVGSLPRASAIPTARNCKYPKKSSNLKRENHGKYFRTLYGPWAEIQNKNWKRWPRLSVRRESFSRSKIYWFSCKIWTQYICDLISFGPSFWHSCQHNNAFCRMQCYGCRNLLKVKCVINYSALLSPWNLHLFQTLAEPFLVRMNRRQSICLTVKKHWIVCNIQSSTVRHISAMDVRVTITDFFCHFFLICASTCFRF